MGTRQHLRLIFLVLAFGVSAVPAQAYVDPGAGGLLFQIIAPFFAIAVLGLRRFGHWVVAPFRRLIVGVRRKLVSESNPLPPH
jgi:hypothetical protein